MGDDVLCSAATWMPRFLWLYAINYGIRCKNWALHPNEDMPSFEAFRNEKVDFNVQQAMPWGQPLEVLLDEKDIEWKFGKHSFTAFFVDCPDWYKQGVSVFNPMTGRICITRNFRMLPFVHAPEWPRYEGKGKLGNSFVPMVPKEGDSIVDLPDTHLLGGNPTFAPPEAYRNQVIVLDPEEVEAQMERIQRTLKEVQGDDATMAKAAEVSLEEVSKTLVTATTADASSEKLHGGADVRIDAADPLQQLQTPASNTVLTPSLLPDLTQQAATQYNSEELEPRQLQLDYVWTSSIDGGKQLLPGATLAYQLKAEEVCKPSPSPQWWIEDVDSDDSDYDCDDDEDDDKSVYHETDSELNRSTTSDLGEWYKETIREESNKVLARLRQNGKAATNWKKIVQSEQTIPDFKEEKKKKKKKKKPKTVWKSNATKLKERLETLNKQREPLSTDIKKLRKLLSKKKPKARSPDNPSMYKALNGPYKQLVKEAIDAELTQYIETYEALDIYDDDRLATLSPEDLRNALSSHFEITYKRDRETGALDRVKARLCIHGNETDKYDFDDVKSPTARTASIKMLIAIMAKSRDGRRFKGRSWDITGAFLQTKIDDRSKAKRKKDPEFEEPDTILLRLPDGRIGALTSYAYGLKQASLEFRDSVDELLRANGYLNTVDPCVYVKEVGTDTIIISCHVDDFLAVSTSDEMLDEFGTMLSARFGKDIAEHHESETLQYMGMVIERCENGDVFVSQPAYYKKLWKMYAADFDLEENSFLRAEQPTYPMHASQEARAGDEEPINSTWYKGIIGALNYLALMTRPDISFAMSVLASKCNAPTMGDVRRVKYLFRFVMNTRHKGLNFKHDEDFQLHAWADASYATRDEARSQSGYCYSLGAGNAAFYSKSTKQQLVTLSSTEAEYVAMFHSSTESVFLRRLLEHMGFQQGPTTTFQDNMSTIHWANGKENFQRVKHLDVKYHYIRQLLTEHVIVVQYLPTEEMIADVLTKPLVTEKFEYLASQLLGVYSFSERIKGELYQEVLLSS